MQALAIGIDIGGTNVSYGIVDKQGEILLKGAFSIKEFVDVNKFISHLTFVLNKALDTIKDEYKLVGVGIGAPNGNYYTGAIENAPNLAWEGFVPLADLLHKEMNVPVFLTNDANAAAMGEMIYGGAKEMKNFLLVTLGTGLGSGFVANGEMILGHDGFAGELGHTIAIPGGRVCGCDRRGCLETYASASGIVRTVVELMADSREESVLRKISVDKITSEDIYKAAEDGDKIAIEAFNFTGKILGRKLADAVAITSPEAIFLFGGLANAGELIFEPTHASMEENMLNIFQNKVELKASSLPENDAAILGSAALVWNEIE